MQIVFKSATSVSIELLNNDIYFTKEAFDVFLNNQLALENVKTNVFSLYGLEPNFEYVISVNDKTISFKTDNYSEFIDVSKKGLIGDGVFDNTVLFQKIINNAPKNAYIYMGTGTYFTGPIFLKSNLTLEISKMQLYWVKQIVQNILF